LYQPSIQSKTAARSPARVGQARVSISSRLIVAKRVGDSVVPAFTGHAD